MRKYQKLIDNLKGNDIWLQKVKEELGKYVHILYMGLEEGKKEKLFTNFVNINLFRTSINTLHDQIINQ